MDIYINKKGTWMITITSQMLFGIHFPIIHDIAPIIAIHFGPFILSWWSCDE